MPRIDDEDKRNRLERIYLLLTRNARGLTEGEIADEVRLERRTVNNYLRELEFQGKAFKDGLYWFPLVLKESKLRSFDLSPEEAMTLYLGVRLLSKQQDKRNEPAESALLKLASVLKADAGVGAEIEQAAHEMAQRPVQKDYQPIFRDLMRGYIYRKKIEIAYRPLNWDKSFQTTFSSYLLEPSPIGFTTYLIGHSSIVNQWRAYKLERIESVRMTKEDYSIPPDFPGLDILRNAWSIVMGEEKVRVVLRFSEKVKARVLETRWHPSQQTREDQEQPGFLLWEVQVADTLDLIPWIRSWGADVEVLQPEGLRKEIIQHVRDLANQYKVVSSDMKPYRFLWAKADKQDSGKVHRLVYHMIDVGQVALALWDQALDRQSKHRFSKWLGCDETVTGRTLAFLISLHDLGKASPPFQIKYKPIYDEVRKAGFWLPTTSISNASPHGVVSTWALRTLLQEHLNISKENSKAVAQALGGHHGTWPTPDQWQTPQMTSEDTGEKDQNWEIARRELVQAMLDVFKPATGFSLPADPNNQNAFLVLFSGFTSVADWIGSMTEFFRYEKSTNIPLVGEDGYAERAAQVAQTALKELGWLGWQADGNLLSFQDMFPFISELNPVQKTIVDVAQKMPQPSILILESPTGSGKTEAALYLADTWLQSQHGRGIYIAMPTQATSNQMYDRVTRFLGKRYTNQLLNVHLVHGGALLQENEMGRAEDIYDDDTNNAQGRIRAETWFLPRKRTLLSPFGVGSVDQALISVLQTRHFFVRMFGLQNKVIVFDEIHAYDTYMSELFKRLLAWLRQIGVSVILLSATLPDKTRRDLVSAYLGKNDAVVPYADYPRLTVASTASDPECIPLDVPSSRTVCVKQIDVDPKQIVDSLRIALENGGCAAVVCNRVQRAQDVYREIQQAGLVPEEDLILLHARFPFAWREEIEKSVLGKFGKDEKGGKNANRPKKSIVVATQVIEQSLDLDFDIIISDLAPIDLLIQRAGRLHRHNLNDTTRPANLATPTLLIAFPQKDDIPDFGTDEYVYERSVMLRTWLALKDKTEMQLPSQTTDLIEAVYGEDMEIADETLRREMEEAIEKAKYHERNSIYDAQLQLIDEAGEEDLLSRQNKNLDEDDPSANKALQAMTRDAEPNVSLICLHRIDENLYDDPAGATKAFDTSSRPDKEVTKALLRQSVSLQNKAVVHHFIGEKSEFKWVGWKEIAALKYLIPIVFENGKYKLEGTKYVLVLDRQTGLTIQKEER